MKHDEFYKAVYDRDNPPGEAHGWVQWKGTDVCVDVHCKCGQSGHVDGYFFYYYICSNCGTRYALGQHVKLIELTEDEVAFVDKSSGIGFARSDD